MFRFKKVMTTSPAEDTPVSEWEMTPETADSQADPDIIPFLNSVEMLTEEDIVPARDTAVRKDTDTVRRIFLLFFAAVFLVSCGLLVKDAISKHKASAIYDELEAEFFGSGFHFMSDEDDNSKLLSADRGASALPSLSDSLNAPAGDALPAVKDYNEDLERMRAGLTSLARINSDIYGWITVEGTEINYPLVQGEDNDFYLNHAYTGEYLPEGAIFVDYRNDDAIADNRNTVFYGHNLRTGGMFHDVTKFASNAFMANNLIYVYTFDGVFIYEPFAFYESRYDYNYFKTSFADDEEFLSFAEEVQENTATVSKELSFTADDRLLTLSTCTNGYYTQRYALHARLVEVIQ